MFVSDVSEQDLIPQRKGKRFTQALLCSLLSPTMEDDLLRMFLKSTPDCKNVTGGWLRETALRINSGRPFQKELKFRVK